jgi:(p)ppGpp synthase/HD superfamily hydrolase
MTRLGEAIALASDVHRLQVDKAGAPYILHPFEVMRRATDYYLANSDGWKLEDVQIVAMLHDALEDIEGEHTWERSRLEQRIYDSFGDAVYAAVDAITKLPNLGTTPLGVEAYSDYLSRVERNWMARIVKIADLSHNLDGFRIPSAKITGKDFDRWDKYHRALVRLMRHETIVKA